METKSKAIQRQIDDAKTAIAKKQKKLAEAIQKGSVPKVGVATVLRKG